MGCNPVACDPEVEDVMKEGEGGYGEDIVRINNGAGGDVLEDPETTGIPAKVPVVGVNRMVFGALNDLC